METTSTQELLPQTPAAAARQPQPSIKPRGPSVPPPAVDDDREPTSSLRPAAPPEAQFVYQGQWQRIILAAGVLVALAALVVGGQYYVSARSHESTDDALVDDHLVHVAPQVAGRVLRMLVTDNQPVKAGDLLVELDPADSQVKLVQAIAAEAAARSWLEQTRWQLAVAEASQVLAEDAVVTARAHGKNAAAKRAAQLTVAQIKAAAAVAQVNLARSQIKTAEAGVVVADVAVAQAGLQLAYTEIRAPRTGRVTTNVKPGEYVQVGQGLLALVSDDLGGPANLKAD
jgi:membrane fusion protein, multidrug efflux system